MKWKQNRGRPITVHHWYFLSVKNVLIWHDLAQSRGPEIINYYQMSSLRTVESFNLIAFAFNSSTICRLPPPHTHRFSFYTSDLFKRLQLLWKNYRPGEFIKIITMFGLMATAHISKKTMWHVTMNSLLFPYSHAHHCHAALTWHIKYPIILLPTDNEKQATKQAVCLFSAEEL